MASPQNPNRPRLGTVLSRRNWEDRRSNSTTSSVTSDAPVAASTRASFDPENEALVSTGPLNHSPPLKDAQNSPKDKAYQIDLKAAKTAFSEGPESGSDTNDISVEIGRGGRNGQGIVEDSRIDDSIHSSDAMIGEYRVMYSPPLSTRRHSVKTSNNVHARGLRQDAQIRLASMASQKENRDPAPQPFKSLKSSDASTRIKRKTLGEVNARTSEMYDGSLLNDDRPTLAAPATKTTRFSRSKRNASDQIRVHSINTATDMAEINQSYLLPDLPNLSQLMSGTIPDGTPGRFRLAAHPALSQTPRGPVHKSIDAVPIPEDEKAIFESLNRLQGKINELEAAAREDQKTIEELRQRNFILKAERRDLKADNDRLRKENLELRMGQLQFRHSRQHEQEYRDQSPLQKRRHGNSSAQVNSEVSKIVRERQEEDLFSLTPTESVKVRAMSVAPRRNDTAGQERSAVPQSTVQQQPAPLDARHGKKVVIEETSTRTGDGDAQAMAREQPRTQDITYLSTQTVPHYLSDLRKMVEAERVDAKKRRNGHEAVSNEARRAFDIPVASAVTQETLPRKSSMKDVSKRFLQSEAYVAVLSAARAEKEKMPYPARSQALSEDITDQVSHPPSHAARRNSDPTATAASNTSRRRRRTTDFEDENMTSAFIIPDITIAQPTGTAGPATGAADATCAGVLLTDAAQHIIHSINPHDAKNCVVCSRLTAATSSNNNSNPPTDKKTIIVPKPIPVSDTPVLPTIDNPDPTLRPAQPPGVALAIVLKELNDQHEHLKARLATAQAKYQQTDPRLSRARRAKLSREMAGLQRQCEAVADMIYRLYDVLEGQRGGGLEMSVDEVEVTVNGLRDVIGRMGTGPQEQGGSNSETESEGGDDDGNDME